MLAAFTTCLSTPLAKAMPAKNAMKAMPPPVTQADVGTRCKLSVKAMNIRR
jgi:hypothetical protein